MGEAKRSANAGAEITMSELKWRSEVDVWELLEEPLLTERADFGFASHVETGPLVDMISLALSQAKPDHGRFVLKFGERVIYRREIENLANRPGFPGDSSATLRLERINEGAQIRLSDGSAWRAGTSFIPVACRWTAGDLVSVSVKPHPTHDHEIKNVTRGETIRAIRSSRRV